MFIGDSVNNYLLGSIIFKKYAIYIQYLYLGEIQIF